MSSDPKDIVKEFLDKNGYPFEMKIARAFQSAGFGIHQSVYYIDPYTKIPREIDLLALYSKRIGDTNLNIFFVVECKYAKSPWILFSAITKGFPLCYVSNDKGRKWLNHLIEQQYFESFFEFEKKHGYGLTVSSKDNDSSKDKDKDNAYRAIQTVLSFLKAEVENPRFSTPNDLTFFVPIMAIKGKLFEAHLDDHSEIDCNEINEAQVFYKENVDGVIPKIHVVTDLHLEKYISRLKEDCERLFIDPYYNISIVNPPLSAL